VRVSTTLITKSPKSLDLAKHMSLLRTLQQTEIAIEGPNGTTMKIPVRMDLDVTVVFGDIVSDCISVGYRRFQLLYLPRNTGSSIYSADQSRPYR